MTDSQIPNSECLPSSLCDIREYLQKQRHKNKASQFVFALDGVSLSVARKAFNKADVHLTNSVFPTTSSSAWYSSITGSNVESHGIVGVVYRTSSDDDLINIYDPDPHSFNENQENIFTDAKSEGILPIVSLCDFNDYPGGFRDALFHGAVQLSGKPLFPYCEVPSEKISESTFAAHLSHAISEAREYNSEKEQRLIWIFLEFDKYIHFNGYDQYVLDLLSQVELAACNLVNDGFQVFGYADHGLVETQNTPEINKLFDELESKTPIRMGGAGRTRWLYLNGENEKEITSLLKDKFSDVLDVLPRSDFFSKNSLAYSRVGEIVMLAKGNKFIAPENYKFDHGSLTDVELNIPFLTW